MELSTLAWTVTGPVGPIVVSIVVLVITLFMWYMVLPSNNNSNSSKSEAEPVYPAALSTAALHQQYALSDLGILASPPIQRLSGAYQAWEELADRMPALNRSGTFRAAADELPVVAAGKELLGDTAQLRRAYVLLGQLTHSYVWSTSVPWHAVKQTKLQHDLAWLNEANGRNDNTTELAAPDDKAVTVIPPQLAVPWRAVCRALGLPCVLCAVGLDGWNWRLLDNTKPPELDNLCTISTMTGTRTEVFFHMVPTAMHARAGAGVSGGSVSLFVRILRVQADIAAGRASIVTKLLNDTASLIEDYKAIFQKGLRYIDPNVFYEIYRPFLGGFYPDGITMTDAGEGGEDVVEVAKGPSAGQSVIFFVLDAFLGVGHARGGHSESFQTEMLEYIPPQHKAMVLDLRAALASSTPKQGEGAGAEAGAGAGAGAGGGSGSGSGDVAGMVLRAEGKVAEYVRGCPGQSGALLRAGYTRAVTALVALRKFHMAVATSYLVRTNTGTGASSFRVLLKDALDDTEAVVE